MESRAKIDAARGAQRRSDANPVGRLDERCAVLGVAERTLVPADPGDERRRSAAPPAVRRRPAARSRGIAGDVADRGRASAATPQWHRLWQRAGALAERAAELRHLSQREPLVQHRPGYPRPGLGRSHGGEVREVLSEIQRGLEEVGQLIAIVLPAEPLAGMALDERRDDLAKRADLLRRLTASLAEEAFRPPPPLPDHAPPYLTEPPGHDLSGTKAVLVAAGLEALTTSLRNLMLAAANVESVRSRRI